MTTKDNHEYIVFCTDLFKLLGFHLNIFLKHYFVLLYLGRQAMYFFSEDLRKDF